MADTTIRIICSRRPSSWRPRRQSRAYLHEGDAGAPRVADIDRLLVHLALPSLGQWVAMLRGLCTALRIVARRSLASHWGSSGTSSSGPVATGRALLALYRRIKNGPDGEPAGDRRVLARCRSSTPWCSIATGVFGHGAGPVRIVL